MKNLYTRNKHIKTLKNKRKYFCYLSKLETKKGTSRIQKKEDLPGGGQMQPTAEGNRTKRKDAVTRSRTKLSAQSHRATNTQPSAFTEGQESFQEPGNQGLDCAQG